MRDDMDVALKTVLEEAMKEAEDAKPSGDPAYWSKRSCNHCYGRGIIGNITSLDKNNNTFKQPHTCSCAQRRFARWKKDFVDNYIRVKQLKTEEITNNV